MSAAETAEGYEGLSWATWWLDDADAVFAARERAYHLYKGAGDVLGSARMATWLGCDELDFNGAIPVANGWLARARSHLRSVDSGPERGWLAFFEGYLANVSGDMATAVERAAEAAEIGRQLALEDLEMLGLALEGLLLVERAEVDDGMRRLDEATALAIEGESEVPIAGAWACCMLVTACTAVRDYQRAFEWCDRIHEFAKHYGSRYMLAFCRAEYGAVHLWRGEWSDAERVLEASVDDFERSRPAMVAAPLVGLAELRRRQGRVDDARSLLARVDSSAGAQLCSGRLALEQGHRLRAAELAERLLRQTPAASCLARAPALELLIGARIARGELDAAKAALDELRGIERRVGTGPLRAATDLAEALLLASGAEPERARALFEDAVDGFQRSGGRFDAARARTGLARCLEGLGQADLAGAEASAALRCFLDLGAESEAAAAQAIVARCSSGSGAAEQGLPELTPREREVLVLLSGGLTNREIADRLVISEHTIHRHVTNILAKLEIPSRAAAAAEAARAGLLDDPRT